MPIPVYWTRQRRNPGPPPVPTPETPLDIFGSDLEIWVEAGQGIVQSGGSVSEWQRIAGNVNVSQADSERRPAYIADDDGRPCIEFSYTRLTSATGGVPGTSPPYTIAGVYRLIDSVGGGFPGDGVITAGGAPGTTTSTIGHSGARQRWWGGENLNVLLQGLASAEQDRFWRSFIKTGETGGILAIYGYVDGVQQVGAASENVHTLPAGLVIGSRSDGDSGSAPARVHSFVVAKRQATVLEVEKLNTYLRWAANLPEWTPFNLGGKLRFWMVSGYGETDLEPGISQMIDLSGIAAPDNSTKKLVQASAGSRPIVGSINSRRAIQFDGTDDFLRSPTGQTHATIWGTTQYEDYTVAMTAGTLKADSFGSPWNQAAVWTDTTGYHSLSHTVSGIQAYTARNGDIYTSYIPLAANVPFIAQVRYAAGTLYLRVNDSAEVTATGGSGNLSNLDGLIQIGSNFSSTRYQGNIAERVICNQTLTTEERANLLNYLSTRWSVAV
jgi:hypothetical protein